MDKCGKLMAAFGNVVVITAKISSGEGKKITVASHFWNIKFL